MDTSSLMEQILSRENLNEAYLQVIRNKGAEGVDGMKYTELKEHLAKNGEEIKEQLRKHENTVQRVGWKNTLSFAHVHLETLENSAEQGKELDAAWSAKMGSI